MMLLKAFVIGGLICVLGQILIDKTKLTPARILVLFVVAGVAVGALGLFTPLKEFAGAGVTVPIFGFGGLLSEATRESIDKDGIIGILTGPLTGGAGGISAAIISGLIVSIFTKPKMK